MPERVECAGDCIQKTTYHKDDGSITLYRCDLWQGVSVWFNEVRLKNLPADGNEGSCLKINYCLSGRCEMKLKTEGYYYQFGDQISISSSQTQDFYFYPTGKYDGIELFINLDTIDASIKDLFEDLGFSCAKRQSTLVASPTLETKKLLEQLAQALLGQTFKGTITTSIQQLRILTLNVIYEIGAGGILPIDQQCFLTAGQREIARRAEEELTADLQRHLTVEQLASHYKVSPSSLKKYFTILYGTNITSYMQHRRCEKAANLLKDTDLKVGEIAACVGYANQGKFGEVFRSIMGCNPLEYRRRSVDQH